MIATLGLALLLDAVFGEPPRWHPLVGFGRLINALEARCHSGGADARGLLLRGALAWAVLVLPPPLLLWACLSQLPSPLALAVDVLVLYLCLGRRSLAQHARAVAEPLQSGDLGAARAAVAMLVSRDSADLDEQGVARAAVESVLENGSDAVVAPLFWCVVAGAPAVLAHRLINTLDARWGYRNERYRDFGRAAARADDVANYLPARLCALLYTLAGRTGPALDCWRRQAGQAASPNAGPVMTAGAGALLIRLGGPTAYHGQMQQRPAFGCGRAVAAGDIGRAVALLRRAVLLLLTGLLLVDGAALVSGGGPDFPGGLWR
ncbi:MAG: adenosylcobinamide-phosphate synthase CbiB [Parahaliea sp.]